MRVDLIFGSTSGSLAAVLSPEHALTPIRQCMELARNLGQAHTLYFRRRVALEQFAAAQANYRQVVLAAFAQVADALRALEHDALAVDAQHRSRQAARQLMDELQANYRAGTAGYLQVLIANAQYQQANMGYLQARTQRLQDTVALFVALGGGWDAAQAR